MKSLRNAKRLPSETTQHIFRELDHCVSAARQAQRSGDWTSAHRQAEKFQRLTRLTQTGELVANSVAAVSNACQHNWIGVAVALTVVCSVCVALLFDHCTRK